ncbi:tetratricopeptide repeat protein [Patescibacteria group bacterium]|nr:tetratricopeptide repeat protein [Patescibacteria group bacterium]
MVTMLELIIFAATVILLIIVLRKLPLEKEVVKKLAKEARDLDREGDDKKSEEDEEDEDLLSRADKLAKDGQYAKAEKLYLKLITKDPQDAGLYNKLALVYLGNKGYKDAATALEQALQIEPDNDTFYNNFGLLFYQQGMYDEAIESYEKSIAINNKVASRFMNLGLAYFMSKKYRKAADAYEKALILEPHNDEYKKLLAEAEEKLK